MDESGILAAFRGQCDRVGTALSGLDAAGWNRPTCRPPWRVRDLLAHVRVVIAWLPGMLAADPDHPVAEVGLSAREYYRPDARFAPATNAHRIALAQDHAASMPDGAALLADFTAIWQHADLLCRRQAPGRWVRTRHGDPMLLTEFLITRVVEVGVHGLDLALALDRPPWLTSAAADVIAGLLLGPDAASLLADLGWSRLDLITRVTGRRPVTAADQDRIDRAGVHLLTLG